MVPCARLARRPAAQGLSFHQAVFGMCWFRQNIGMPALLRDHGISRATGYRYLLRKAFGREPRMGLVVLSGISSLFGDGLPLVPAGLAAGRLRCGPKSPWWP